MKEFEYKPEKAIREFDGRLLEGVEMEFECQHTNKDLRENETARSQWIAQSKQLKEFPDLHLGGWVEKVMGKKDEKFTRIIRSCKLIQHSNGGRSEFSEFDTYAEYFNDKRREKLLAKRAGGILMSIMGPKGEHNQADVRVRFDDFKLESSAYAFTAPEEWFTTEAKDLQQLRFVDGFYEDAEKAIHAFHQKNTETTFGERYFPVLVFPKGIDQAKVDEIIWRPKVTSHPVMLEQHLVYGTRCKPHEFEEVILSTYLAGGKVPIGVIWDW